MAEETYQHTIIGQLKRIEDAKADILDRIRNKGVDIEDVAAVKLNNVADLIDSIKLGDLPDLTRSDLSFDEDENQVTIPVGYETTSAITITVDEVGSQVLTRLAAI